MAESDASLASIFEEAKFQNSLLDQLDSSESSYKETLHKTIVLLEKCQDLIQKGGVFSRNETVEDITTSSLPFLTVDYFVGDLLMRSYHADRARLLAQAASSFQSFLSTLEDYELLSKSDHDAFKKYVEAPKQFQLAGSDASERRRLKIERFQSEKALKSQLQILRGRTGQNAPDEETVRKLHLTELNLFASRSLQALDMMVVEVAVLADAKVEEHERARKQPAPTNSRATQDERLDGSPFQGSGRVGGPLLSKSGKPLQPFVIMDKRSQFREGVFKPGHNLPTMTIDEYLEEEKRRGGIIEGGGPNQQFAPQPDEDDHEAADKETMKAREWDEYVEANPKGSGNTINRG